MLDVVEVHRHVGDVAEEAHASAIRRDVDVLRHSGAVEVERVESCLALDGVIVVARVPDEGVVAGAEERHVVTIATVDHVAALGAEDQIRTEAAVDRQPDGASLEAGGVDDVVTAQRIEDQPVLGIRGEQVRRRLETEDRDTAGITRNPKHVVALGGVHRNGVDLQVGSPRRASQVDVDRRDIRSAEVADNNAVAATQRMEVDRLDIVQVHGDGGDVAEEAGAPAIRRDVDGLACVRLR